MNREKKTVGGEGEGEAGERGEREGEREGEKKILMCSRSCRDRLELFFCLAVIPTIIYTLAPLRKRLRRNLCF